MGWLDSVALFLIGCVGLHVPRSFTLLYVLIALVFGLSRREVHDVVPEATEFRRWRLTVLLLLLFSASYCLGMLSWGLWTWSADRLDLINALLLPALLFVAGLQAASLGRMWSTRLLLAYALGAVLYPLIALMLAREPWWSWGQIFPSEIQVPWGASTLMNVRSVEQNAYPALLLLPPALLLLVRPGPRARRLLVTVLVGLGLLGGHVIWSLNGRLGWLALLCAGLPIVGLVAAGPGRQAFHWWRKPAVLVVLALGALPAFLKFRSLIGSANQGIWSQGFCDERLSMFGGMLSRLHEAPWGGRLLRVPYLDCDGVALLFAAESVQQSMAHDVVLDVYFNAGIIPTLFLLIALAPPLLLILKGFIFSWRDWDWEVALRWSWLCLLLSQWLFQPLLYSDGLLFYFSFFLLGLFAVESRRGFDVASIRKTQVPVDSVCPM
jgi:hypothetical protein